MMTPSPVLLAPAGPSSSGDGQGSYQAISAEQSQTRIINRGGARWKLFLLAGGGIGAAAAGLFLLGRALPGHRQEAATPIVVTALPQPAAAPAVAPPSEPVAPLDAGGEAGAAEPAAAGGGEGAESGKHEANGRPARPATPSTKELDESLHQAQQLLHAQRYDEARAAFGKLLVLKPTKRAAAVGLAQIAFQEKDYKQAVDRAKESVRLGGGVEARVLLGDAYFKLQKYEEAKKAYNEALKLDPNNKVAGQGLRLIESQAGP
jgi:tetratricopeptide (TPR) repeat protein